METLLRQKSEVEQDEETFWTERTEGVCVKEPLSF